jgi:ferredoxin
MAPKLQWNPITCDGRGLCAELFAERIALDDWGYPIVSDQPVPPEMMRDARAAVAACPMFALKLG